MNLTINADQLIGESICINKIKDDISTLKANTAVINQYYTKEELDSMMNYVTNEICDVKNNSIFNSV